MGQARPPELRLYADEGIADNFAGGGGNAFPRTYIIDRDKHGNRFTATAQVRMVGNSVCPPVAAALARAQFEDQVIEVAA